MVGLIGELLNDMYPLIDKDTRIKWISSERLSYAKAKYNMKSINLSFLHKAKPYRHNRLITVGWRYWIKESPGKI